jgi:hypothetical protein
MTDRELLFFLPFFLPSSFSSSSFAVSADLPYGFPDYGRRGAAECDPA